jgi:hypothetical protein
VDNLPVLDAMLHGRKHAALRTESLQEATLAVTDSNVRVADEKGCFMCC